MAVWQIKHSNYHSSFKMQKLPFLVAINSYSLGLFYVHAIELSLFLNALPSAISFIVKIN